MIRVGGHEELTPFDQAVEQLELVATVPAVVQRLFTLLADPAVSWPRIEQAMAPDGGLVARVLRMASSPAFAAQPVRDLQSAFLVLGSEELRRVSTAAYFTGRGTPFVRALWTYSLQVAFAAAALARMLGERPAADPFLCGLLHDIGTMVNERIVGRGYAEMGFAPGDDAQPEIERDTFGYDHTDLGAMVASRWNLFPELELVAQLHHEPDVGLHVGVPAPQQRLVDLVALARVLGRDPADPARALRDRVAARLGLEPDLAEGCGAQARRETAELLQTISA